MHRDRNFEGSSSGDRFERHSFAPVQVGEEFETTIEAVGEKGDGLAKKNGFVIFVPGVKQGQKVRVKVTKVLRKVGFGEVVGGSGSSSDAEAPSEGSADAGAGESTEAAPAEESSEEQGDSEEF